MHRRKGGILRPAAACPKLFKAHLFPSPREPSKVRSSNSPQGRFSRVPWTAAHWFDASSSLTTSATPDLQAPAVEIFTYAENSLFAYHSEKAWVNALTVAWAMCHTHFADESIWSRSPSTAPLRVKSMPSPVLVFNFRSSGSCFRNLRATFTAKKG